MKDFERFFKAFKPRFGRLVMTSNLGRVNKNMRELAKYINREYEKNMDEYLQVVPELKDVELRNIFPAAYRDWVLPQEFRRMREFIMDLYKRAGEFKDKISNYRVMISFLGFYVLFFIRLFEIYYGAAASFKQNDPNYDVLRMKLKDIGITMPVFKFYSLLEDLRNKTIDEWLSIDIKPEEETYILALFRRIFYILGF